MDLGDIIRTCRLCLETCNSSFEVIDEIIQSNLNSILLYPNLAITDEAVICETCAKNLEHSLEFKAKCVLSEDHANLLMHSGTGLKESHNGGIDYNPQNKCRFCLELDKNDALTILGIDDLKMLCIYFPEMVINLTEAPVVCTSCHESLQLHFNFMKNCSKVEEKITEYCRIEITNSKGHIDLNSVANFAFKTMKNEDRLHAFKMEEYYMEEEIKSNLNSEVKEEKIFAIKHEIDIKVEEATEQDIESFEYDSLSEVVRTNSPNMEKAAVINCHICQYQTSTKQYLHRHMIIHKDVMHKCTKCDFQTKHTNSLQRHMLKHKSTHEVPMNKCPLCDFQSKFKANLNRHLLHHKRSAKVAHDVNKHLPIQKNGIELLVHKCTLCNFETVRKDHLRRHMVTHKSPSEVTMHKCTECSFESKHKNCVRNHMRIHKSADELAVNKCGLCEYRTKCKYNLNKHTMIHKNKCELTVHKCKVCNFETIRKNSLNRHMVVHKSEAEVMMYKCTECRYETKYKDDLVKHLVIHKHPAELPVYVCDMCSFKTRRKDSFQRHLMKHKRTLEMEVGGPG